MSGEVDLSIRQFREAWQLFCAGSPTASLAAADGVEYVFSGLPISFFNIALLTEPRIAGDRLEAHGRSACTWAADKNVPWFFIVTQETLESGVDAGSVLDACGLAPVMTLTGMLAERITPPVRRPENLTLGAPQDDAGCAAMVDINSLAYSADLEAGKSLIGKRSFWSNHAAVLGTVDDRPACSAAVLMVDGFRYVALVATDPTLQRRGYAEAAMRRALEAAAEVHGDRPTTLHATDAGLPIYKRMGYDTLATHTIFMEQRFLAGH